jgi:hypothetical protein
MHVNGFPASTFLRRRAAGYSGTLHVWTSSAAQWLHGAKRVERRQQPTYAAS